MNGHDVYDAEIAEQVNDYVQWLIDDIENEFCDDPMDTNYIINLIGQKLKGEQ